MCGFARSVWKSCRRKQRQTSNLMSRIILFRDVAWDHCSELNHVTGRDDGPVVDTNRTTCGGATNAGSRGWNLRKRKDK